VQGSESISVVVPNHISDRELQRKINEIWYQLVSDLTSLPSSGAPELTSSQKTALAKENIVVRYEGAGVDPATIALIISLTPVIKAVVPLVEPFAKDASDVAHKIALDLWDILRQRLWQKEHINLVQRES